VLRPAAAAPTGRDFLMAVCKQCHKTRSTAYRRVNTCCVCDELEVPAKDVVVHECNSGINNSSVSGFSEFFLDLAVPHHSRRPQGFVWLRYSKAHRNLKELLQARHPPRTALPERLICRVCRELKPASEYGEEDKRKLATDGAGTFWEKMAARVT